MKAGLPPTKDAGTDVARALDVGRVIELANAAKFANWSSAMNAEYIRSTNDFLLLMRQRDIPFVVVGGIALLQHVPGRNTEDLDIILAAPHLAQIPELEVTEQNEMFAKASFRGLRVDVLFYEHPFFQRIGTEFSAELPYSVGRLRTATIDGLILLKLFALPSLYRQFDLDRAAIYEADLTQLLARTTHDDPFFLDLLRPFLIASDVREIGMLLGEIRQKLSRLRRGGHDVSSSG